MTPMAVNLNSSVNPQTLYVQSNGEVNINTMSDQTHSHQQITRNNNNINASFESRHHHQQQNIQNNNNHQISVHNQHQQLTQHQLPVQQTNIINIVNPFANNNDNNNQNGVSSIGLNNNNYSNTASHSDSRYNPF